MKKSIVLSLLWLCTIIAACKKENTQQQKEIEPEARQTTRSLGLLPTPGDKYTRMIKKDALAASRFAGTASCSSVDLTNLFPAPGDQGLQGSCVSWVVAYSVKSFQERQELGWNLTTSNHLFSPQYVYSQTHYDNSSGGGGSYFQDALNLVTQQGVSTLDITPYSPWDPFGYTTQPTADAVRRAFPFHTSSWSALPYRDVDEIRSHLCANEPVLLGIPIYPDFDNLTFGNDTYDNLSGTLRGLHAITLIGYDDNKRAFRFVNQWGTSWGLNGYGWISYNLIANNDFENYVMYDEIDPIYTDSYASTSTAGVTTLGYYSGDFNGDGNTDIIQPWNNNGALAIIVHNVSASGTNILWSGTMAGTGAGNVGIIPVDINGDGKTDLAQAWSNGGSLVFSIFTSNGSSMSFFKNVETGQGISNLKFLPVDMDGDGKTDIAQLWNNNGKLAMIIYRSTGTTYTQAYSNTFNINATTVGFVPADYDGDGKTDIIQLWDNNGNLGVIGYTSSGSSYSNTWSGTTQHGTGANLGFIPVDYNGDGKIEFLQAWNNNNKVNYIVYRSNGNGLTYISNSTTRHGITNLAFLPVKTAGQTKTGVMQVWANGGNTSFIRYDVATY